MLWVKDVMAGLGLIVFMACSFELAGMAAAVLS